MYEHSVPKLKSLICHLVLGAAHSISHRMRGDVDTFGSSMLYCIARCSDVETSRKSKFTVGNSV